MHHTDDDNGQHRDAAGRERNQPREEPDTASLHVKFAGQERKEEGQEDEAKPLVSVDQLMKKTRAQRGRRGRGMVMREVRALKVVRANLAAAPCDMRGLAAENKTAVSDVHGYVILQDVASTLCNNYY